MRTKSFLMLLALATLCPPGLTAEDGNRDMLSRAWSEYRLGEYSRAENLFHKARRAAKDDKSYCEALTGIAFCLQFTKKQQVSVSDYRQAIELYQDALDRVGESAKYTPFLKAMTAECYFNIHKLGGDKDALSRAMSIWSEIQRKWPGTLAAQDALLFQVISMTGEDYSTPKAAELAEKLEDYLRKNVIDSSPSRHQPPHPNPKETTLAAVMCNYLGDFHFWRGDYKTAIEYLVRYCRLGPTSYAAKADALFRIARTSEMKLRDMDLAIEYYRKFVDEIKSDSRRYFAQQKIKSLTKEDVR